jgi:hypothetical protein
MARKPSSLVRRLYGSSSVPAVAWARRRLCWPSVVALAIETLAARLNGQACGLNRVDKVSLLWC